MKRALFEVDRVFGVLLIVVPFVWFVTNFKSLLVGSLVGSVAVDLKFEFAMSCLMLFAGVVLLNLAAMLAKGHDRQSEI